MFMYELQLPLPLTSIMSSMMINYRSEHPPSPFIAIGHRFGVLRLI